MNILERFILSWEELIPFFQNGLVIAFLLSAFLYASYTDIMEYKIYDKFNFFLLVARLPLVFIPVYGLPLTWSSYLGSIVAVIVLLIPAVVFLQKMGGDIKFMGVMGFYLGLGVTIFTLILGCIYMLLFSLIRKIVTKQKIRYLKTPMAPFFCASFFTLLLLSYL